MEQHSTVRAGLRAFLQYTVQYLGDLQYALYAWIHQDRASSSWRLMYSAVQHIHWILVVCNCSGEVKWIKHVLNSCLSYNNTVLLQHFGAGGALKVSIVWFTLFMHWVPLTWAPLKAQTYWFFTTYAIKWNYFLWRARTRCDLLPANHILDVCNSCLIWIHFYHAQLAKVIRWAETWLQSWDNFAWLRLGV